MSAVAAATSRASVLVMAVGNILRRDDGFADAVLKALEGEELPAGVELFDAGTSIIELMDVFRDRDKLIVIDAIDGGGSPGTLYRFSPQEVDSEAVALHDIHQLEALSLGELIDCTPGEAVVIGVQPKELGLGIGLSPELVDVVPKAIELIKKEIALSF